MGKIVKSVAAIAVVAAIAYFAPGLGLSLAQAIGGPGIVATSSLATAMTAVVAVGLSVVAGVAMKALGLTPKIAGIGGFAPLPPTLAEPKVQEGFGWAYKLPDPDLLEMTPLRQNWWQDEEWPWQRVIYSRPSGNCMLPVLPVGWWVKEDRDTLIRAGDLINFGVTDIAPYCQSAGFDPKATSLIKRFVGIDTERAELVVECTNPPTRIRTPMARVTFARKVIAMAATREELKRA